jgi:PKD repeat protein
MKPLLGAALLSLALPAAAFAQATAAPASGPAPLTVTFSPGSSGGSYYQWQFNSTGGFVPDYSSEIGESVIHTYPAPGTYTALLRIYDAVTGLPADHPFTITVLPPPAPPTVSLGFAPYPTLPDQTITFTAAAVPSPGRAIAAYSFDFNNDGVEDASSGPGPTGTATSSFPIPLGAHTVTVTAVDSGGLAGKATAEVRIGQPPKIAFADPKARLTLPSTVLSLSVTSSFYGPWTLDHYDWDFGGGAGTVDPGGASATVSFAETGTYTVTATVTDTAGHSASAALPVEVIAAPGPGILLVQHDLMEFAATYTVMAFPPAGSTITSYGWDFNNDGVDDDAEVGTGPTATWQKMMGETGPVVVKAYLSAGGPLTATLPLKFYDTITQGGAPLPISLTATADGAAVTSPLTIRVGHVVSFLATAGGGSLKELLWDFDGDGLRDQMDSFPAHPDSVADIPGKYQYRNPGTFQMRARILSTDGSSGEEPFTVNVVPGAAPLECYLAQPRDGQRVWGNHVSIQARTAPAVLTKRVDFSFRPEGGGAWTPLGSAVPPPYTSLSCSWDVTKLVPGASYELRAVATDTSDATASSETLQTVTVVIDPVSPDEEESLGDVLVRTHTIDPNVATRSEIAGDTAIEFPPHAFGMEYTTIRLERPFSNPHPFEARLQGLQFVPGSFRRLVLDGGAGLQEPSKIALYDINPSGVLDNLGVDPAKLKIYQFDDSKGQWVPLFGQVVQPGEDLARATLMSMGDVGLVMEPAPRAPSGASSGGCGLLGLEFLLLLAFAAVNKIASRFR